LFFIILWLFGCNNKAFYPLDITVLSKNVIPGWLIALNAAKLLISLSGKSKTQRFA
jgi:hypothetical protein